MNHQNKNYFGYRVICKKSNGVKLISGTLKSKEYAEKLAREWKGKVETVYQTPRTNYTITKNEL